MSLVIYQIIKFLKSFYGDRLLSSKVGIYISSVRLYKDYYIVITPNPLQGYIEGISIYAFEQTLRWCRCSLRDLALYRRQVISLVLSQYTSKVKAAYLGHLLQYILAYIAETLIQYINIELLYGSVCNMLRLQSQSNYVQAVLISRSTYY